MSYYTYLLAIAACACHAAPYPVSSFLILHIVLTLSLLFCFSLPVLFSTMHTQVEMEFGVWDWHSHTYLSNAERMVPEYTIREEHIDRALYGFKFSRIMEFHGFHVLQRKRQVEEQKECFWGS